MRVGQEGRFPLSPPSRLGPQVPLRRDQLLTTYPPQLHNAEALLQANVAERSGALLHPAQSAGCKAPA